VIVPLIGGGGLIALIIAYVNQSNVLRPTDTRISNEHGTATPETASEVLTHHF
jgi:hypothetical protein